MEMVQQVHPDLVVVVVAQMLHLTTGAILENFRGPLMPRSKERAKASPKSGSAYPSNGISRIMMEHGKNLSDDVEWWHETDGWQHEDVKTLGLRRCRTRETCRRVLWRNKTASRDFIADEGLLQLVELLRVAYSAS